MIKDYEHIQTQYDPYEMMMDKTERNAARMVDQGYASSKNVAVAACLEVLLYEMVKDRDAKQ